MQKNPNLLRFHSPRIKLKKTAFFKGSRGISHLKGDVTCNWFKNLNFFYFYKLHPNIDFFEETECLIYGLEIAD